MKIVALSLFALAAAEIADAPAQLCKIPTVSR